ncbi:hypothetical protein ACWF5H_00040 [Arthrobacter sp. NPDC055138]
MDWAEDKVPAVRMFPDYADTVLWFDGPVDYAECGLSERLIRDLTRWEQGYYDALVDVEWRAPELAAQFTEDGIRLAQQVAGELGEDFEVEFRSYENGAGVRRFRGRGPGSPEATAAFGQRAASERDDREQLALLKAEDETSGAGGWFAYAPESGLVFRPRPPGDVGSHPESRDAADRDEE